ncbi:MAG: hypothetical protein IJW97_01060 [Clostridia bacterium]|nr:hypothetical protein [Clostridia bacterium]
MTEVPATQTPSRDTLAAYVHDAYELEKKIYAMEELRKELISNRGKFEKKIRNCLPSPPQRPDKLFEQQPEHIITEKEEEEIIQRIVVAHERKMPKKIKFFSYVFEGWKFLDFSGFDSDQIIGGIILLPFILIYAICLSVFRFLYYPIAAKKQKNKIAYSKNELKKEIQEKREVICKKNKKAEEYNLILPKINAPIKVANEQRLQSYERLKEEFRIKENKAWEQIKLQQKDYQNQIDMISDTIVYLQENRRKLYALDILAPDYCELKHLHYIDHYFKNKLVDTIKEAVIMYRQEAFQEMVGLTLGNILASINTLTGEVRQLGIALQRIHMEVANISQEVFQIRTLQEDIAAATQELAEASYAAAKETRAQRYATEALRESNARLEFYEQQRYYGYL